MEKMDMVFSSLLFLFRFLPIVLILYFLFPKKARNAVLFFSSLVFYAWGEPVYISLMLFSTIVDYIHGRMVESYKRRGEEKKAKLVVLSSVIINLSLLCTFKYLKIFPLPIGISFYTFQTMSYTIDVYRGDAKVQKNLLSFGAYVAMFPQLIAGPIVQYKTIAQQLDNRKETIEDFSLGIRYFIIGLGKKVLYANNIGLLWEEISQKAAGEIPVVMAWIGIMAYALQIYFDFSGYSDMAVGLGKMFGFHFSMNFHYPYRSKSITEFWRRWHISLGTWFKEYVYIPLGGNRKGLFKQIRNIAIVWLLTGIWHGASLNFLLWGIFYGIILIIEKMFLLKWLEKAPNWIGHLYASVMILCGWVLFAFEDMQKGWQYFKILFFGNFSGFINGETIYLLLNYGVLFILACLASIGFFQEKNFLFEKLPFFGKKEGLSKETFRDKMGRGILQNIGYIGILLAAVAYLVDSSYNPFLYFRF